jgi:toxin ParE1/3/4
VRYRIVRHDEVRFDLAGILDFVGNHVGYAIGKRKIAEISESIAKLVDFPHIGTVRSDIAPDLRALPCAEKAVICFTVDDQTKTVKIVCVTYAGQDWQKIARNRE